MKRKLCIFSLFIILSIPHSLFSQDGLLDSLSLDTLTAYTSLSEALKTPEKVVKLILKRKQYSTFPPEIFQFTNLQYLDISKNNIASIPNDIGKLSKLQYLSVSKNKIEMLPYEIGNLSNLYFLDASRNNLFTLPVSIGKLSKLKHLDLWDNLIEYLPEEISNCKNLKTVDLRGMTISQSKQDQMQSLVKSTNIHFSPPCKCSQ